ncbi:hypothetical protein BDY19DRAFT_25303 [Irpex rosettiformis]|uniref:Uncharacterized protein n=1 Tax=Irpex rosettiformis TaxID=378272 RepID=A0ACB8UJG8_9APHY|nr:hypothetical protein BDY19DRAFT_25303 [Irpex rosettiformis]
MPPKPPNRQTRNVKAKSQPPTPMNSKKRMLTTAARSDNQPEELQTQGNVQNASTIENMEPPTTTETATAKDDQSSGEPPSAPSPVAPHKLEPAIELTTQPYTPFTPPVPNTASVDNPSFGSRPAVFLEGLLDLISTTPSAPPANLDAGNTTETPEQLPAPPKHPWTQMPPTGWPNVHCNDPMWRFRHWHADSVRHIWTKSADSVIIFVWGIPPHHRDFLVAQGHLRNSLNFILPGDEQPEIYNPQPDLDAADNTKGEHPATFAICNLSENAKTLLLNQRVYSLRYPEITFFVHDLGWEIPTFITLLQGFSTFHDRDALRTSIKATINTSEPTRELIHTLVKENQNFTDVSTIDVMNTIINSVEIDILPIKLVGGVDDWKVGLYMTSPTAEPKKWMSFRDQIQSLTFCVYNNGNGTKYTSDLPCSGCGATDHPRGLCPYRLIPGWNGQATASEKRRTTANPAPNKFSKHSDAGPSTYYNDGPTNHPGGRRGGPRGRGGHRGRSTRGNNRNPHRGYFA